MSKSYSPDSLPQEPLPEHLAQAIEAALVEREAPDSSLKLFDLSFPKQTEFLQDQHKRKALWCTRRAAKSYTDGLALCDTINTFHEVNTLYLGLTKDSAMGIIWNDILLKINRDHNLGMHFRESKRDVTSKTGSRLYISGADADADEMHKLLGRKYKRIVIDEAQSFSIDMRTLVYGILGPTLVDLNGDIILSGTAGNLLKSLFYDITLGKEPGWKVFSWTAHDNPYVAKQWQEELDAIARERPLFKGTNLFKQWYLNEWVIDENAKVYRFSPALNRVQVLPILGNGWHYVLGLDLAHSPDSTAFVVGAYHDSDPRLYLVYAHKSTGMDVTAVALFVKSLEETYEFDVKVVDGANKQAVAELNNRHSLSLIAADKTGKADFIKLMNDDFIQAKILLLPAAEPLAEEYGTLIWMTDANGVVLEPKKENEAVPNDLADAGLYLWRYCYNHLFQKAEPLKDKSKQDVWEPAHIAKLEEQVRKAQNPNELDLDWNESWDEQEQDDY